MVSLRVHEPAVWSAPSLLSTITRPGKERRAPHSWFFTVSPDRREVAALSRVLKAAPSRVWIYSGPPHPLVWHGVFSKPGLSVIE